MIPTLGDIVYYIGNHIDIVTRHLFVKNYVNSSLLSGLPALTDEARIQVIVLDCHVFDNSATTIEALSQFAHLSLNEALQLAKRKNARQKLHYVLSRSVIKYYIAELFSVSPTVLDVAFNQQDAQLQVLTNGRCIPVSLSLSHSQHMIAIAFDLQSTNNALGVDVEMVNSKRPIMAMADMAFSSLEKSTIENAAAPFETCYQLWTQKEALIKATGGSVFGDLNTDVNEVLLHHKLAMQTKPVGQYMLSVAYDNTASCHIHPVVTLSNPD